MHNVDVHKVSSHLINITAGAESYKRMLREDLLEILVKHEGEWVWKHFWSNVPEHIGSSREYKYENFDGYLKMWSNFNYEDLSNLFSSDLHLRDLLREAKYGELESHGGDRRSQEAREQPCSARLKYGTATHTIARLQRDNPELHERVVSGELSANKAAIEAGFRKPPLTPLESLLKAWRSAEDGERKQFLAMIQEDLND
jgi:hypothetical protein